MKIKHKIITLAIIAGIMVVYLLCISYAVYNFLSTISML